MSLGFFFRFLCFGQLCTESWQRKPQYFPLGGYCQADSIHFQRNLENIPLMLSTESFVAKKMSPLMRVFCLDSILHACFTMGVEIVITAQHPKSLLLQRIWLSKNNKNMRLVWNAHLKHHPLDFHRFSPRSHCSFPKVSPGGLIRGGGRQKDTKKELCKKRDICGPCRSQEGTFGSIFHPYRVEICMSGYMIHTCKHIHMCHVWIHVHTRMCHVWIRARTLIRTYFHLMYLSILGHKGENTTKGKVFIESSWR